MRNVARCWTGETAAVLGEELQDDLPWNDYYEYYADNGYSVQVKPNPSMENTNTRQQLEAIKQQIFENLRMLQGAPGVQMEQARLPRRCCHPLHTLHATPSPPLLAATLSFALSARGRRRRCRPTQRPLPSMQTRMRAQQAMAPNTALSTTTEIECSARA